MVARLVKSFAWAKHMAGRHLDWSQPGDPEAQARWQIHRR